MLEEGWQESTIEELLKTEGKLVNWGLRLTEDDDTWKYTEDDLETIAPPLTRILNRYDATRAAAAFGDEALLATGLSTYAIRNYSQRKLLIRRLRAAQDAAERAAEPAPAPVPPPVSDADAAAGDAFDVPEHRPHIKGGPHRAR